MMRKHYYSILVLVLAVFLSHPAFATKCVKPNGAGACYDNIQDAIDAVNPGGTVKVYPGIYYGYFDADKAGITILGMGNKRTDARVDLQGSPSNVISDTNVTIKNLTVQNCFQGIMIRNTGSFSKIIKVNILNSENNGVLVNAADDILIKNCKILKSGDSGVNNANGERLTVQNTTISDCDNFGIFCTDSGLTVDGCTIKNSGLSLIHVEGSQPVIHDNQLFQAGEQGIYVENSDFVLVTGNLVKGTGLHGIGLSSVESAVFKKNTVMHAQGDGFFFHNGGTPGGELKMLNNLSSYNNGNGFFVYSVNGLLLFKKNVALNNKGRSGIGLEGSSEKTIIENQSRHNTSGGFSVQGTGGTFEKNIASENGGSGVSLPSAVTAIQNKAINNMSRGFTVQHNSLLRNNRAIGNLEYGILVIGDNNDIINNIMLDSLYDKCEWGTNNTWTNNTYDTECP